MIRFSQVCAVLALLGLARCGVAPAVAITAGATIAVPLLNLDTAFLTWYLKQKDLKVVPSKAKD